MFEGDGKKQTDQNKHLSCLLSKQMLLLNWTGVSMCLCQTIVQVGQVVLQVVHVLLLNLKFCVSSALNSYLLFSMKLKVRLDIYTNVKVMKHCP